MLKYISKFFNATVFGHVQYLGQHTFRAGGGKILCIQNGPEGDTGVYRASISVRGEEIHVSL